MLHASAQPFIRLTIIKLTDLKRDLILGIIYSSSEFNEVVVLVL